MLRGLEVQLLLLHSQAKHLQKQIIVAKTRSFVFEHEGTLALLGRTLPAERYQPSSSLLGPRFVFDGVGGTAKRRGEPQKRVDRINATVRCIRYSNLSAVAGLADTPVYRILSHCGQFRIYTYSLYR